VNLPAEHQHMLVDSLKNAEVSLSITRAEALTRPYPQSPKLGHAGTHKPRLALGDYLSANASPPSQVHRGLFTGYTNVLANDTLGDCAEAMTLHGIEGMHHAAGTPVPAFTAQDAISLYETVGGYVPSDPSTDQGTDNDVLVKDWQSTGVKCAADGTIHKIVGSVAVDFTNTVECQVAIYEFAALFCAYNMPLSAQGQRVWSVVGDGQTGNSAPGSWGGHDVVAMAYDDDTLDDDSWGMWIPSTAGYRKTYGVGFFAVATEDMLNRSGISPTGLNWTALIADLQKL
jgi:hypothetical protein